MRLIHSSVARELVNHPFGTVQVHRVERTYRKLWWRMRRTVQYIAFFPASLAQAGSSMDNLRAMRSAVGVGMSRETALLALAASYQRRMHLSDPELEGKPDAGHRHTGVSSSKRHALTHPRLPHTKMV